MIRSRAALTLAACLAGAVSGSIAIAQASTTGPTGATAATGPTSTPATITVNGADRVSVDPSASDTSVQASYLTALTAALTDAKTKATALATASGDTLGAVQNITEQSSDAYGCSGPVMYASGTAKGAPAPGRPSVAPKKTPHPSSKPKAVAGLAVMVPFPPANCTIEADVTVTYAMAPA